MPSQDRVRGEDGGDFPQSLAADGMSLHGKYSTLIVIEQQSLFSELLQQGLDLCVLEFDDLLLALVHQAAETGQQDVPWLKKKKACSTPKIGQCPVPTGEIKSWNRNNQEPQNTVSYGILSSAEFFYHTG